jgi:hypothetical protein
MPYHEDPLKIFDKSEYNGIISMCLQSMFQFKMILKRDVRYHNRILVYFRVRLAMIFF